MKTDSNSYSKMKEEGARFLFIRDFNRDTNSRSLKSLKESVVRNGGYLVPIQVMKVGKYREAYPDTILVDPENDRHTVERAEEKETDYLVLDGQHRLSVHIGLLSDEKKSKEPLAFDLPVQVITTLPEGMDPHRYIYTLNTTGTQWNDKNRTKLILAEKDNEKTGLEISEDGVFVQKSYSDSHTGDMKYFTPEIHRETDGREYVNWSDSKVYIDEMVCTCFHGSSKEGQSVVHIDGRVMNSKASNLKWS